MGAEIAGTGARQRILLVDDVELNRVLTEAVLAAEAYEVDCADGGAAALRAVDAKSYDLVLMDLDMPGLDGYAATSAIRQKPAMGAVRVAALTSRNSPAERERARQVGMGSYLTRPLKPRDLVRAVASLLASPIVPDGLVFRHDVQDEIIARLGMTRTRGFLATLLAHCEATCREIETRGPDLDRKAHDLASTSGMLGFEDLSNRCRDVLLSRDAAQRADALPALSRALLRAMAILERQVERDDTAA